MIVEVTAKVQRAVIKPNPPPTIKAIPPEIWTKTYRLKGGVERKPLISQTLSLDIATLQPISRRPISSAGQYLLDAGFLIFLSQRHFLSMFS